jgi:diketogulonate reductase-like aldo/keto reductase
MRTVRLRSGQAVPQLGLGTWRLGERSRDRAGEVAAVRFALDIGYRLIDTAEMYGDGGAEEVVGAALRDAIEAGDLVREDVTIVSKVVPSNASRRGTLAACERSLKRLGVDAIDIYLLHWRGSQPLGDTVAAFEELRERGKIAHWGVSNFDVADLEQLHALDAGGQCTVNQVYYSASERGIEFDLLPWQRKRQMPIIAYCPIDQGALAADATFATIGRRRSATAAQVALAWVMRHPDAIAIPKASNEVHLQENLRAASIKLDAAELAAIDAHFTPPKRKRQLAMT